jgi:hypothetical protein
MRSSRLLGAGLVVIVVSIVAVVASASAALPNVLPEPTAASPVGFITTSGTSIYGSGVLTFSSTASAGEENMTSGKLGAFKQVLQGTTNSLSEKCTGLSDTTAGNITVVGTFHIRDAKETVGSVVTLVVAVAFLLSPVHFSCGTTLWLLTGCIAGLLQRPAGKAKELAISIVKSGTDNKIIKILNEANTAEENCEMKVAINEGSLELTAEEIIESLTKFSKGGLATELEVMPL